MLGCLDKCLITQFIHNASLIQHFTSVFSFDERIVTQDFQTDILDEFYLFISKYFYYYLTASLRAEH